jgi:hypothetical protein
MAKFTQEEVFNLFMQLPVINAVQATFAQGSVKHYNVIIKTDNLGLAGKLMSLWPFCTITSENGELIANYIVKPEEVDELHSKLEKAKIVSNKKNEVALMFQLKRLITEELKQKVESVIRSSDRIVWGDNRMAVILSTSNPEAVKIVERRVKDILSSYYGSEEGISSLQVI